MSHGDVAPSDRAMGLLFTKLNSTRGWSAGCVDPDGQPAYWSTETVNPDTLPAHVQDRLTTVEIIVAASYSEAEASPIRVIRKSSCPDKDGQFYHNDSNDELFAYDSNEDALADFSEHQGFVNWLALPGDARSTIYWNNDPLNEVVSVSVHTISSSSDVPDLLTVNGDVAKKRVNRLGDVYVHPTDCVLSLSDGSQVRMPQEDFIQYMVPILKPNLTPERTDVWIEHVRSMFEDHRGWVPMYTHQPQPFTLDDTITLLEYIYEYVDKDNTGDEDADAEADADDTYTDEDETDDEGETVSRGIIDHSASDGSGTAGDVTVSETDGRTVLGAALRTTDMRAMDNMHKHLTMGSIGDRICSAMVSVSHTVSDLVGAALLAIAYNNGAKYVAESPANGKRSVERGPILDALVNGTYEFCVPSKLWGRTVRSNDYPNGVRISEHGGLTTVTQGLPAETDWVSAVNHICESGAKPQHLVKFQDTQQYKLEETLRQEIRGIQSYAYMFRCVMYELQTLKYDNLDCVWMFTVPELVTAVIKIFEPYEQADLSGDEQRAIINRVSSIKVQPRKIPAKLHRQLAVFTKGCTVPAKPVDHSLRQLSVGAYVTQRWKETWCKNLLSIPMEDAIMQELDSAGYSEAQITTGLAHFRDRYTISDINFIEMWRWHNAFFKRLCNAGNILAAELWARRDTTTIQNGHVSGAFRWAMRGIAETTPKKPSWMQYAIRSTLLWVVYVIYYARLQDGDAVVALDASTMATIPTPEPRTNNLSILPIGRVKNNYVTHIVKHCITPGSAADITQALCYETVNRRIEGYAIKTVASILTIGKLQIPRLDDPMYGARRLLVPVMRSTYTAAAIKTHITTCEAAMRDDVTMLVSLLVAYPPTTTCTFVRNKVPKKKHKVYRARLESHSSKLRCKRLGIGKGGKCRTHDGYSDLFRDGRLKDWYARHVSLANDEWALCDIFVPLLHALVVKYKIAMSVRAVDSLEDSEMHDIANLKCSVKNGVWHDLHTTSHVMGANIISAGGLSTVNATVAKIYTSLSVGGVTMLPAGAGDEIVDDAISLISELDQSLVKPIHRIHADRADVVTIWERIPKADRYYAEMHPLLKDVPDDEPVVDISELLDTDDDGFGLPAEPLDYDLVPVPANTNTRKKRKKVISEDME